MASMFVKTAVALLAMLVVHQWSNWGAAAESTCANVYGDISPCVTVFNSTTHIATTSCCNGMFSIYSTAVPSLGNQGACSCIESWFTGAYSSSQTLAAVSTFTSVSKQCNVTFGFNISDPGSCQTS